MADAVICNCLSVEKDLIENFCVPFEKTVVIPNPVDTERIRALGLGAKRPYQDGRIDIISVGRLIQQKGYDLLLRGLKVAVSRVPEIQLTIVGEGPEETVLRKLARSLEIENNVTFAGGQGNPYPYISNADLFVSSSRWEGCPNVILESLACGTPVLAFDCPGGTGEIIRDGKNGWLVPPGDEVALGNRMAVLVENGEYRNVDRKRLLPRQFECRSVVDRYEALFKGADPG
jgi:glycosyltransferase involved in cell wall biosynthesis